MKRNQATAKNCWLTRYCTIQPFTVARVQRPSGLGTGASARRLSGSGTGGLAPVGSVVQEPGLATVGSVVQKPGLATVGSVVQKPGLATVGSVVNNNRCLRLTLTEDNFKDLTSWKLSLTTI
jgi:hypothetical protein